jgi:lysyl-tRNA synthetase class 2
VPGTEAVSGVDWRPGADRDILKLRAQLLARIRTFFSGCDVLEVDTPALSRGATTDPAIESCASVYHAAGSSRALPLYLHTSPEFFMKRLLAAGSGPVYQLAHVFRNGESGRRHNLEFMLLEWYRPGKDAQALMDEVDALMIQVLAGLVDYRPAQRLSYRQWFLSETGLDPWRDSVAAFRQFAMARLPSVPEHMPEALDPWLDLLVTHWLEPRLGTGAVFVHDYPASQASLAQLRVADEATVAERFELYINGVELANGFHELADSAEQLRRFEQDNLSRIERGQAVMPVDRALIAALEHGLPDCSGVAVGVDRLVMLAAGLDNIDQAMAFSLQRV